jgi:DNA-binding NarL/FixJ family response regulator
MQRIVVIDAHENLRKDLRILTAFDPDLLVVGEAGTMAEGMAMVQALVPSVVLLATELPDAAGLATCRYIRELLPQTPILMLTSEYGPQPLLDALHHGAKGCVRNDSAWGILRAIRALLSTDESRP